MAIKKKKTVKKTLFDFSELKGLFGIAIGILLFLSLISFTYGNPSLCYLGLVGYLFAFASLYLLGWASFALSLFILWWGWKSLLKETIPHFSFRLAFFIYALFSLCILLNVLAENNPKFFAPYEKHLLTEKIFFIRPFAHQEIRYNVGGVPFYFLYKDLPYGNLKQLFTDMGITLIFLFSGLGSLLLFLGFRFQHLQKFLHFLTQALVFLLRESLRLFVKLYCFVMNQKKKINFEPSKPPLVKKSFLETPPPTPVIVEPIKKTKVVIQPPILEKQLVLETASSTYELPSSNLLSDPLPVDTPILKKELQKQAEILEKTLESFGILGKVGEINCGPTITSFEVHPPVGVKVQKIKTLENDIALNLQAKSIRIIAPIPGKAAVGVEIPSLYPQSVTFKELLLHYQQTKKRSFNIPLLLGKTVTGEYLMTDLTKMPHLLIAGATGSGKSVCINTIVMSILMNASFEEIRLLMIDPKKVELTQYSSLPHMIAPVITEAKGAYAALQWLVREMQNRYEILKLLGLRNVAAFNQRKMDANIESSFDIPIPEKMPFIVGIIDEFADLMMVSSSDLETPIARIAQMARAVGIHLILATQRPSREVITGIIKANFPCRIAFKVASRINSQIILDETGAESLLGNGDLLFLPPGTSSMVRAQGAFISDDEITRITQAVCKKSQTHYLIPSFDALSFEDPSSLSSNEGTDELYDQALTLVLASRNASTTFLQRKLKIGYARAASIMDQLEQNQVIGPQEGSKPRRILRLSKDDLEA